MFTKINKCVIGTLKRIFFLVCLFMLLTINIFGQNQIVFNRAYNNYNWVGTVGGQNINSDEYTRNVSVLNDGYIISGSTDNMFFGGTFVNAYIVKVSLYGDTIWQTTFDRYPTRVENIIDIQVLENGKFLMVGEIVDTIGKYDCLLLKMDENGNKEWYKTFGYTDLEISNRITKINNNYYVLSYEYYIDSTISHTSVQPYITKIDSNGNIIWYNSYGDSAKLFGLGYIEYIENNIITSGAINDYTNPYYYTILKIDTNGNLIDSFNYFSNDHSYISAGNRENTGYYYDENGLHIIMTGLIQLSPNNDAGYIMSVNENYEKEWERIIDAGPENELFISCQVLPDGRIVAISYRAEYENPNPNGGTDDLCWLIMLDKHGNTIWERYINAYDQDFSYTYPYQIKTALDGGFVITGYVINNTIQSNGIFHRNDAWLCKTDSCGFTTGATPQALLTVDSIKGPNVYISNLSEEYCIATLHTGNGDSINIYAYSQYTNGTNPSQLQYTFADTGTYTLTLYTYAGDGIDTFTTQVHIADTATGIRNVIPAEAGISISLFPNPTKDYVIVQAPLQLPPRGESSPPYGEGLGVGQNFPPLQRGNSRGVEMNIYTPTGQLVQTTALNPRLLQQKVNLQDLSNGVYLVNFMYQDVNLGTKRISVVR